MSLDESPRTEPRDREPRDERWYLTDEREFLQRSLADADREREAGDLSSEDHALLVARDQSRLAEVEGELAALDAVTSDAATSDAATSDAATSDPAKSDPAVAGRAGGAESAQSERAPMPLWRRLGIAGACLLIAAGAVILVTHFVQTRQPGQASSGSVTVSQAQLIVQQLAQANALDQQGSNKAALELYNKVLSEDPSNPAALAYAGFLQWNVGRTAQVPSLVRIGRAEIETSVKDSPTYFQGHLFDGLVLANQDGNDVAAVAQFNDFLADGPPAAELPQAAPLVSGAYKAAGVPLPSQFSAGSTTTTTSAP
jgi:tetratricopeptide (TPR) repeat protein